METKEQRFLTRLRETMISLPYDLKIFFSIMADADQPDEVRHVAAGTVMYVVGPSDLIPDHLMPVGYVDDAIVLWTSLEALRLQNPGIVEVHGGGLEGFAASVEATARVFRDYLGPLYDWLAAKVPDLAKQVYKGKHAAHYIHDPEGADFLYNEAQAFTSDFDLDEEYLALRLNRGKLVTDALAKKQAEESLRRK
jgi:uncharacterized membrane protein YkvA (DUF1232 family)